MAATTSGGNIEARPSPVEQRCLHRRHGEWDKLRGYRYDPEPERLDDR
jgi:hypothetical protein